MEFTNMKKDLSRGKYARSQTERNYCGTYYLLKINGEKLSKPFEAWFYATDSAVYCSLWISLHDSYGHGVGKTSGWGYDRLSAAMYEALKDAGVEMTCPEDRFAGTGMENAMNILQKNLEDVTGKLCQLHSYA